MQCEKCNGKGIIEIEAGLIVKKCKECGGRGEIVDVPLDVINPEALAVPAGVATNVTIEPMSFDDAATSEAVTMEEKPIQEEPPVKKPKRVKKGAKSSKRTAKPRKAS